jgi:hypothetical protein
MAKKMLWGAVTAVLMQEVVRAGVVVKGAIVKSDTFRPKVTPNGSISTTFRMGK